MTYLVYKGNASIEERPDSTLVRVGRRQASLPLNAVSASDLRQAALDLIRPMPISDTHPSRAAAILDRLGAIARTDLQSAHLPGWSYVLRHADNPDDAMRQLSEWQVAVAPGSTTDVAELDHVDARFAMFSPPGGHSTCSLIILDERPTQAQLRDAARSDARLFLVIDPAASPTKPASVILTDDLGELWRLFSLRLVAPDTTHELPSVGSPIRRLLLTLGIALLVDRAGGMRRLRNGYAVSRELAVTNMHYVGLPASLPLSLEPSAPAVLSDAQIVDRLLIAAATDVRLKNTLSLDIINGTATATCEWTFMRRARSVTARGEDLSLAATRAFASAVAYSLKLLGFEAFSVRVGSAQVQHGARTSSTKLARVDVERLLGTDCVQIDIAADFPEQAPDAH